MTILPYSTRPLEWIGDSKDALSAFPKQTKIVFGHGLRQVQNGSTPAIAKPMTGLGSGVFELKANHDKNTYRVVYVVRLKRAIYVLAAFMKKSHQGSKLPPKVVARIKERLKCAQQIEGETK